jgi:hypothetical protein
MIEISLKGFAKFVVAGHAAQRRVLQDFKYPDSDEPHAMRLYYVDARDRIEAYHKNPHSPSWLDEKVADLDALASLNSGRPAARLRDNAKALRAYRGAFASRQFEVLKPIRLPLDFGSVRIRVIPDLHVREKKLERVVRLEFAKKGLPPGIQKVMGQCLFEAAVRNGIAVTSASALIFDVFAGKEVRGARAGSRALHDIEAACQAIEALWDGIDPPVRRRRSRPQ